MHYDFADIIAAATPIDERTRTATITLAANDTAWKPTTTKAVFTGPGAITYTIAPEMVDYTAAPTVSDTAISILDRQQ